MNNDRIVEINIENEMKTSYIDYSMSVIVSRALPDVRDGFKPVHRRVLFGMEKLGNFSNAPYKKSARIVGDVLGKYHPHGDSSVYFAMVRLGQNWAMRYPLVDGQGNYGSIDGDSPAAMRYTEARLSKMGEEMMGDIDEDTVDFVPNFDDTLWSQQCCLQDFQTCLSTEVRVLPWVWQPICQRTTSRSRLTAALHLWKILTWRFQSLCTMSRLLIFRQAASSMAIKASRRPTRLAAAA